jgi:tetratricopeptide (TPR) repeat protein
MLSSDWYDKILRLIVNADLDSALRLSQQTRFKLSSDDLHRLDALEAFCFERKGDVQAAILKISNARQLKPSEIAYEHTLAGYYFNERRWIEAADLYRSVIDTSLSRSEKFFLDDSRARLSICLIRLGTVIQAIDFIDQLADDFETRIDGVRITKSSLQSY